MQAQDSYIILKSIQCLSSMELRAQHINLSYLALGHRKETTRNFGLPHRLC